MPKPHANQAGIPCTGEAQEGLPRSHRDHRRRLRHSHLRARDWRAARSRGAQPPRYSCERRGDKGRRALRDGPSAAIALRQRYDAARYDTKKGVLRLATRKRPDGSKECVLISFCVPCLSPHRPPPPRRASRRRPCRRHARHRRAVARCATCERAVTLVTSRSAAGSSPRAATSVAASLALRLRRPCPALAL